MKKLLAVISLCIPLVLSASVIDEKSPWGVVVWHYTVDGVSDK